MPELLSQREVAGLLGVTLGTLANWRSAGGGPRYVKMRPVKYRKNDVETFINERVRKSTSDAATVAA